MIEYPVKFSIQIGEQETQFLTSPDKLYEIIATGIKDKFKINPDEKEEVKTLARVVRASVKAALIAFGPKLLDLMFKSKDHPKPEKGDDILEWYADMFAKILVAGATQGTLILRANTGEFGNAQPIIIDEICPIAVASGSRGGDEDPGTGIESRPENPDSTS